MGPKYTLKIGRFKFEWFSKEHYRVMRFNKESGGWNTVFEHNKRKKEKKSRECN